MISSFRKPGNEMLPLSWSPSPTGTRACMLSEAIFHGLILTFFTFTSRAALGGNAHGLGKKLAIATREIRDNVEIINARNNMLRSFSSSASNMRNASSQLRLLLRRNLPLLRATISPCFAERTIVFLLSALKENLNKENIRRTSHRTVDPTI